VVAPTGAAHGSRSLISDRVTYLGTGIGDLKAAKRYLRNKFRERPLEPIVSRPGARFYVTVRSGQRLGYLLGPYVSHMTALAAVPRARRLAEAANPSQAAFASFGTTSRPDTRPTLFGR
jgi:hypothetical protein